jgi:hypothetical protein
MAFRVAAHLPRVAIVALVFVLAGATLTYGAAKRLSATQAKGTVSATTPTVVVPDVTGQAFVFAKGALEDGGFAWRVAGSVHGYAVNKVVSQSPVAGTELRDTGAPTITVGLERAGYKEAGEPEDISPYTGTAVVLASTPVAAKPVSPAPIVPKPVAKKPVVKKPVAKAVAPTKKVAHTTHVAAAKHVAARPPAFVVRGEPKEPLKEMPLTNRAKLLSQWLSTHSKPTSANVRHFLYQNAWVVTGARFGWWHGADALRLLIAADAKAARMWGVGSKSEVAARQALAEVEARSR